MNITLLKYPTDEERAYCEYVGKETAEWTEPGLKKPFTGGRDGRH